MAFPPIPVYPLAIDSDRTLYLVHNTVETRSSADNQPWAEEISIVPVAADKPEIWADNGFGNISGELFYYDSVEKDVNGKVNKLKGCARNIGGNPTRFNHAGVWVRSYVIAEHHNQLAAALIQIEAFLLDLVLPDAPECVDDFNCNNVTFNFTAEPQENCAGSIATYSASITGSYTNARIDFGDGTSTTLLEGTHTYAPNTSIDPLITVENDFCTIVQTPPDRTSPNPIETAIPPVFDIPLCTIPELPDINIPILDIPSTTITFPQIILPDINVAFPNISIYINIPSFSACISLPSVISITPVSLPSVISFGPISIPSIISFTPISIPSMIDIPPLTGISIISIPPITGISIISIPGLTGISIITVPPLVGISIISIPGLTGISIITIPGLTGISIISIPGLTGISIISIPPLTGISIISIPPLTGISLVTIDPLTGVSLIKVDPLTGISMITVPPLTGVSMVAVDSLQGISIVRVESLSGISYITVEPVTGISLISVERVAGMSLISVEPVSGISHITVDSLSGVSHITVDSLSGVSLISVYPLTGISLVTVQPLSGISLVSVYPLTGISLVTVRPLTGISLVTVQPLTGISEISIIWGEIPTISVNWGSCSCTIVVSCAGTPAPFRAPMTTDFEAFEDGFQVNMQPEVAGLGIPSEIKIIAPEFTPIQIEHNLPSIIEVKSPGIPNTIEIKELRIPIPSEIKIINETNLPDSIQLNVDNLPSAIKVDGSSIPKTIELILPDKITIDASDIPDTIQVVGVPSTIELIGQVPSEIFVRVPDDLEIPLVYKGGPIPVQFDTSKLGDPNEDDPPCFAITPCPKK